MRRVHIFSRSIRILLTITLGLWASATAGSHPLLFEQIDARLELMDDVAAHKWGARQAIEDIERERVVLAATRNQALMHGLEPEASQFFFRIQIEAAREIQHYWFEQFASGTPVPAAADLDEVLRPELLRLGRAITTTLANSPKTEKHHAQRFHDTVSVEGLSQATAARLFGALVEIHRFPDRLTQIKATGLLRVGTTGDYAPFSHSNDERPDPEYAGIDIEMARDLAAYLGVELTFVRTSWPGLMPDLASGAFDVGMSGISLTRTRQESAFFSQPYFTGGKTPIARCSDRDRFTDLITIDQPTVRVIVNPGGTNFLFAHENIKVAKLIIHEDNRTIFDEIVAGRADVMITDAIEVQLKSKEMPGLCATMPGETLTRQQKAYLLPRDEKLRDVVTGWLAQRLEDGTLNRLFAVYMNPR
ncbi:MAG: transporter substrate-binding domain-containing protein [Pseudomonadales bacterium]